VDDFIGPGGRMNRLGVAMKMNLQSLKSISGGPNARD
jgi:hypothetical protein